MKILITNVYSYKNKGDAAIVVALVSEVQRVFVGADILIQTTDALNDEGKYGAPITSSLLWLMLSSYRDAGIITRVGMLAGQLAGLGAFLVLRRWFGLSAYGLLRANLREYVRQNEEADLVIACGGGYLRTETASASNVVLLMVTCLNFLTAHYLGKRVYLYSQSIGPVHGWLQHRILRFTLGRVDLIEAREDITVRYLEGLGVAARVVRTADPAFLLKGHARPAPVKLTPGPLQVGITVRKWFKTETELARYITAMAGVIDYLAATHHAQVYYIPQVIAANFGDDDRLIAERVQRQVTHADQFHLLTDDLHPFELAGLCGQMDIFIGTRMHSNIFALIGAVPVVAIEYEYKTRGIMEGLGLSELTLNIADVELGEMQRRVDELLGHRDHYRRLIETNLTKEAAKSRSAMDLINQDYREHLAKA